MRLGTKAAVKKRSPAKRRREAVVERRLERPAQAHGMSHMECGTFTHPHAFRTRLPCLRLLRGVAGVCLYVASSTHIFQSGLYKKLRGCESSKASSSKSLLLCVCKALPNKEAVRLIFCARILGSFCLTGCQ